MPKLAWDEGLGKQKIGWDDTFGRSSQQGITTTPNKRYEPAPRTYPQLGYNPETRESLWGAIPAQEPAKGFWRAASQLPRTMSDVLGLLQGIPVAGIEKGLLAATPGKERPREWKGPVSQQTVGGLLGQYVPGFKGDEPFAQANRFLVNALGDYVGGLGLGAAGKALKSSGALKRVSPVTNWEERIRNAAGAMQFEEDTVRATNIAKIGKLAKQAHIHFDRRYPLAATQGQMGGAERQAGHDVIEEWKANMLAKATAPGAGDLNFDLKVPVPKKPKLPSRLAPRPPRPRTVMTTKPPPEPPPPRPLRTADELAAEMEVDANTLRRHNANPAQGEGWLQEVQGIGGKGGGAPKGSPTISIAPEVRAARRLAEPAKVESYRISNRVRAAGDWVMGKLRKLNPTEDESSFINKYATADAIGRNREGETELAAVLRKMPNFGKRSGSVLDAAKALRAAESIQTQELKALNLPTLAGNEPHVFRLWSKYADPYDWYEAMLMVDPNQAAAFNRSVIGKFPDQLTGGRGGTMHARDFGPEVDKAVQEFLGKQFVDPIRRYSLSRRIATGAIQRRANLDELAKLGTDTLPTEYRAMQVPFDEQLYGRAAGKWLPEAVYYDAMRPSAPIPGGPLSLAGKVYKQLIMNPWRVSKTLLSATTQATNHLSNYVFAAELGNANPVMLAKKFPALLADLRSGPFGGPITRNYEKFSGLLRHSSTYAHEIPPPVFGPGTPGFLRKVVNAGKRAYTGLVSWTGQLYETSDELFKLGVFDQNYNRGVNAAAKRFGSVAGIPSDEINRIGTEAIKRAEATAPNYATAPPLVHWMSQNVMPFSTWPYVMARGVVKDMEARPQRYLAAKRMLQDVWKLGTAGDQEGAKWERDGFDIAGMDWMNDPGVIRIPDRFLPHSMTHRTIVENGQPVKKVYSVYWNTSNLTPYGNLMSGYKDTGLAGKIIGSNPALNTVWTAASGKILFSGADLAPPGASEEIKKTMFHRWLMDTWLPSWAGRRARDVKQAFARQIPQGPGIAMVGLVLPHNLIYVDRDKLEMQAVQALERAGNAPQAAASAAEYLGSRIPAKLTPEEVAREQNVTAPGMEKAARRKLTFGEYWVSHRPPSTRNP